jgi:hypothetical protein
LIRSILHNNFGSETASRKLKLHINIDGISLFKAVQLHFGLFCVVFQTLMIDAHS